MAGMRYQPQGRPFPASQFSTNSVGFLPAVGTADVFGGVTAASAFNNPARVANQHGLARRFNGSSTYMTAPLPGFVDLSQPFAIVLAFVPASLAISRIVHFATSTLSFQLTVQDIGTLSFMCGNSSGDTARVTSNAALTIGRPYVAVAAFDGTNYSLYLNGVPQSGTPVTNVNNAFSSVPINMGRRGDSASYFSGDIALLAHMQGRYDGASLSANPWQIFSESNDADDIAQSTAPTSISAAVSWTEGADTASVSAVAADMGALAWKEAGDAASIAATVLNHSTLAWSEIGDFAALTGSVTDQAPTGAYGGMAWVEAGDTSALAIRLTNRSTVAYAEQGDACLITAYTDTPPVINLSYSFRQLKSAKYSVVHLSS